MTSFSLTTKFLETAALLQKDVANKAFKALLLYYANPSHPGLHFEKLTGRAAAMHSIRVDQAFRIILQRCAAVTIFHFVGNHDTAYRFADSMAPTIVAHLRAPRPA